MSSLLRDRLASAVGTPSRDLLNPDLPAGEEISVRAAAAGLAGMEEARAALAEDLNLNPRLVLEQAFLNLSGAAA